MNNRHPWQLKKKSKILRAVLEHCQFSRFTAKMGQMLNWHCCSAGSSKTAPTILIFSIIMCADYSFELISTVHWVPQFVMHNKSILGGSFIHMMIFSHNTSFCMKKRCRLMTFMTTWEREKKENKTSRNSNLVTLRDR